MLNGSFWSKSYSHSINTLCPFIIKNIAQSLALLSAFFILFAMVILSPALNARPGLVEQCLILKTEGMWQFVETLGRTVDHLDYGQ